MPIYDYACTACHHVVEVVHSIHVGGPLFCPNCGAEGTMRKGFSTPAVHFKGSGWAKKDRSTSSASSRSSTSKATEGGEAGSNSGKDDNSSKSTVADAQSSTVSESAPTKDKTVSTAAPDGGS